MRRIRIIILSLMLILVFTGCANDIAEPVVSDTGSDAVISGDHENDAPVITTTGTDPDDEHVPKTEDNDMIEAVYLGVYGYGTELAARKNMDSFTYRFLIDGEEKLYKIDNGPVDENGNYSYPIQNILKVNYTYEIETDDDVVIKASEVRDASAEPGGAYEPPVSGEPGVKTLKNFLKTALAPVGTTLYIYGGGWDWQDIGASVQVKSIGVSDDWVSFFNSNDASFTYRDKDGDSNNKDPEHSYYPYNEYNEYYYAGLDCAGYASWVLNNTFNEDSVETDYFSGANKTAIRLSERDYGTWTHSIQSSSLKPGDVVSISGHVWISLGTCSDGSVVIMHSTPSDSRTGQPGGGAQISAIGTSNDCEAYKLADKYMSEYYKEWYSRYPTKLCDPDVYFKIGGDAAGTFSWDTSENTGGLTDPDNLQSKSPAEVLAVLFG